MCEGDGMEEWKECKLGDFIKIKHGYAFEGKSISFDDNNIVLVTPGNFAIGGGFQEKKCKFFHSAYPSEYILNENDLIVTMTDLSKDGDTLGYSAKVPYSDTRIYLHNQRIGLVQFINSEVDKDFIYWFMRSPLYQKTVLSTSSGSTVKHTSPDRICGISVKLPPLPTQQKIATILSSLDDKIELNNKINTNLEQQAQALFKNWFVDFEPFGGKMPEGWKECKAEEYFEITIGKTPPRKEQEWFSEEKTNQTMKWVSISDMGSCGLFISDSSEYLTTEAVAKFNVKVVPANTIILSFKLTVGRIAITDDEMCTNEAIAHFGTKNKVINEYLYLYLKNFNYQTMGSTSSIATAVNSKIIKAMPFILPDEKSINDFHLATNSLFEKIRENQHENSTLSTIRDTLLPKLMNGEINI